MTSQPVLTCDANLYDLLGKMVHNKGWAYYFSQGPLQEPLFPLVISWSLRLSEVFGPSYLAFQKGFQLFSLFATQLLTLVILRQLRIDRRICAAVIFYLGFSPALVNSALSLYSEIMVYPFVLGMVIAASLAWQNIFKDSPIRTMGWGAAIGTCALGAVMIKGIFELIAPLFVLPFVGLAYWSLRQKNTPRFKQALSAFLAFACIFFGGVLSYKAGNQHYNGHFVLTNRASWALYGNIARRSQPMDKDRLITAAAYVPGERFCRRLRTEDQCDFWSYLASDGYGFQLRDAFDHADVDKKVANKTMVLRSIGLFFEAPLKQLAFCLLEGVKMLFWESTRVGYVEYTPPLSGLFACTATNSLLKLATAFLTLGAWVYFPFALLRRRKESDQKTILLFCTGMILSYIGVFSLFHFLIRYAFAIVPLFLVLIAVMVQDLSKRL